MQARGWRRKRSCHYYEPAGVSVCFDQLVDIAGGCTVDLLENVGHGGGDVEEPDPSFQERLHRNFVRGIECTRVRPAPCSRLTRERKQRKHLEIRRMELERETRSEIERRPRRRLAGGIREGERDRHPHVG